MKGSGAATARSGGVAVSGVQFGDNYLAGVPVARSAYIQQVQRIAPAALVDRDQELSELAAFCTDDAGLGWVWWQAPAWAGKSALMAWFVLHPPPGVRVVSFFITARWFSNSDRTAFVNVMLEQLAEVAEQPVPTFLTDANREAHFLDLLEQAAESCQEAGGRLVLVVDGLDEDRGVTADPDSHSIAALLPDRPPAGMRVIVAGRPDPPVPLDVPEDHPLRDPGIVRPLTRSSVASVIRDQATRELRWLLRGTPAEQQALGLVTAAGGGLSSRDLAELTGSPASEITDQLETVSGRTFTRRESRWADGTALYVLAHEELQVMATERLGDRLGEHRTRIHAWAEEYRGRHWPASTPEYLLRGYFSMLQASQDLDRMVALCLDSVRHDRIVELSGGDHASLTEIATTLELVTNGETPDLLTACRLAIRRDRLRDRSSRIPTMLPALWGALGDINRAEALARSITNPSTRVDALAELAVRVGTAGDLDRGGALLLEAEAVARSITEPYEQVWALANLASCSATSFVDHTRELIEEAEIAARSVARSTSRANTIRMLATAAIKLGDLRHAETLIRSITEPGWQALPLAELGLATMKAGDMTRALELAEEARSGTPGFHSDVLATLAVISAEAGDADQARLLTEEAKALIEPAEINGQRALGLTLLTQTVADAGDLDRAHELAEEAENITQSIDKPYNYSAIIAMLANVAIKIGDLYHAENLSRSITEPDERAWPLAELGLAMAEAGDLARARELAKEAETLAHSDLDPFQRTRTLVKLATAMTEAGDLDRALTLIEEAENLARSITDPDPQVEALADVATAAVGAGDLDRARTLVEEAEVIARSSTTDQQDWMLAELARVLAQAGDPRRAETLARSIPEPYEQTEALSEVAIAAARAGDRGHARRIAASIENVSRSARKPHIKLMALTELARAFAEGADLHHAQTIALSIPDAAQQAHSLADLSETAVGVGDLDQAEVLARLIAQPFWRMMALAKLTTAAADAGEPGRARELAEEAETLAEAFTDPDPRANALTSLAEIVADAGDLDRARALVEKAEATIPLITNPERRDLAWEDLPRVMGWIGDVKRGETLARSIADSSDRAKALGDLAEAAAKAGDMHHAESLAVSIIDLDEQAETLAKMASLSTPDRARRYIMMALALSEWTVALDALAKTDLAVLREIADDFLSDDRG